MASARGTIFIILVGLTGVLGIPSMMPPEIWLEFGVTRSPVT